MKSAFMFFGFLIITSFTICHGQTHDPFILTEDSSNQIMLSQEAKNLFKWNNSFLDKIQTKINEGVSLETIKNSMLDAAQSNNYTGFYTLLFDDYNTGNLFFNEISNYKQQFRDKYTFVTEHPSLFQCQSCPLTTIDNINYFFNNFGAFSTNRFMNNREGVEPLREAGPVCGSYWNQVLLLGCAAGCSVTTAGFGAGMCGWACWCTFCTRNSSVAEVICAN